MGYAYQLPPHFLLGPPPPPPPRNASSTRASSHDGSEGSVCKVDVEQPVQASRLHEMCTADCSSEDVKGGCTQCAQLVGVVKKLEMKLVCEVSRVQQDAQNTLQALGAEQAKWKKERDMCWKHVGELKEQNRLLAHRNHELGVQNNHLQRHVVLLQEQMQAFKDNQAGMQAVLDTMAALSSAAPAPAAGLAAFQPSLDSSLLSGAYLGLPSLPLQLGTRGLW